MSMDQGPTTPTSPPPASRPRPHSRGFSYGSNRSSSEGKVKYTESPQDKARRDSLWKGLSKANPNAAITENQPGVANLLEQSTLQNLREIRHKDAWGNDISDPDRSNPTRPRMERPLDTIRNFEKAIDDGYTRRTSYKQDSTEMHDRNNEYASRRSSYFGGEFTPSKRRQSYANDRPAGMGAQSQASQYGNGGGYYGNQGGGYYGGQRGPPSRMRYGDRMQSDPNFYGGQQRPYPQHGYHQSYDTVNTHGSDSTGPWANSTDPSSENSSLDRVVANKPDGYGGYQNGYNGPIAEEQGYGDYANQDGYGTPNGYFPPQSGGGPPPPPPHRDFSGSSDIASPRQIYARNNSAPMLQQHQSPPPMMNGGAGGRRPMQLNSGPPPPSNGLPVNRPPPQEKRKSWLARRFSKKD